MENHPMLISNSSTVIMMKGFVLQLHINL